MQVYHKISRFAMQVLLFMQDSVGHDSVTSSTTDDPTAAIDRVR